MPTVTDIGLTHKDIHEARIIRDAECGSGCGYTRVAEETGPPCPAKAGQKQARSPPRLSRKYGMNTGSRRAIFAPMAWTIQTLIDDGMRLNAYCQRPGCGYNAWLDLEALKTRLGPDHPAMVDDLAPRLKCSRCGAKGIGLSYSPEAAARAGGSR